MNVPEYLVGLFRRFRSRVLGREVQVVGQCNLCGRCCRGILLRNGNRWLRRKSQYEKLVKEAPEHARFKMIDRNDSGYLVFTCSRLGDDNICISYKSRPALCRNYPAKSLYYRGGNLMDHCGYSFKATTFREEFARRRRGQPSAFSEVLQQEIEQEKDKQK